MGKVNLLDEEIEDARAFAVGHEALSTRRIALWLIGCWLLGTMVGYATAAMVEYRNCITVMETGDEITGSASGYCRNTMSTLEWITDE